MVSLRRRVAMLSRSSLVDAPSPPPPFEKALPSTMWALPQSSSGCESLCELNSSLWDVLGSNDIDRFGLQEGDQDDGNILTMKISKLSIASNVANQSKANDDNDEKVVTKRKRGIRKKADGVTMSGNCEDDNQEEYDVGTTIKKSKGKEVVVDNANYCNMMDDKGRLCGKTTNPENTLCDRHLKQLRSHKKYDDYDSELEFFEIPDSCSDFCYFSSLVQCINKRRNRAGDDNITIKEGKVEFGGTKKEQGHDNAFVNLVAGSSNGDGSEEHEKEGTKRKRERKATNPCSPTSLLQGKSLA